MGVKDKPSKKESRQDPARKRRPASTAEPERAASATRPAHHPGPLDPDFSLGSPDTRIYVGDCREALPRIPEAAAGKVDLIFADPPFNWNRAYDKWHDAMPEDEYLRFTRQWLDLCVRALKPTGALWVNIPDDWAAEIVVHLKGAEDADKQPRDRMHMVNWCIWHYRFGQNTSGRFINSKVHVLYFSRHPSERTWNEEPVLEPSDRATTYADPRTWNKKEGAAGMRLPMDVWYGKYWGRIQGNNAERRRNHDNQIPEVYLERVIRACSNEGDLVLDPFLGSGTTCTVARELKRRSIGVEFSRENAASCFKRIEAGPIRVRHATPTRSSSAIFGARSSESEAKGKAKAARSTKRGG